MPLRAYMHPESFLVLRELNQYNARRIHRGHKERHVNYQHIVCLGLGLVGGSGIAFVLSWIVLGILKGNGRVFVERTWFRCLATCFYVGLTILLASAVGSVVQNTVRGSK
jgi:hypothetical protein